MREEGDRDAIPGITSIAVGNTMMVLIEAAAGRRIVGKASHCSIAKEVRR
jgi:hypothetical protein